MLRRAVFYRYVVGLVNAIALDGTIFLGILCTINTYQYPGNWEGHPQPLTGLGLFIRPGTNISLSKVDDVPFQKVWLIFGNPSLPVIPCEDRCLDPLSHLLKHGLKRSSKHLRTKGILIIVWVVVLNIFYFHPGNVPIWLIFFNWVETTN